MCKIALHDASYVGAVMLAHCTYDLMVELQAHMIYTDGTMTTDGSAIDVSE